MYAQTLKVLREILKTYSYMDSRVTPNHYIILLLSTTFLQTFWEENFLDIANKLSTTNKTY